MTTDRRTIPPVITDIRRRLAALADPDRAAICRRFFKTGPGQYGEGDESFGIRVPLLRKLSREFRDMPPYRFRPLSRF